VNTARTSRALALANLASFGERGEGGSPPGPTPEEALTKGKPCANRIGARRRQRYTDLMIAAIVAAGQPVLVTRHQADFRDLLPQAP
jgi:hypothetical protein